ncbi:MAG: quinol:cytochrome C oxidoreductase [Weeksellaceae bacterium]|uniref:quinol:cytochrome C oxidoreductase n=1 Tax=Kaistella soli TaxID=2849654 RepID=UPI000B4B28CC|nr:quinol:cytochrome C oxidoreductase [Kaistella soli]MBU4538693.1 quinol:cytochrome C oxidoreductase [Bacteroidota bacterium]MBU8883615.1 quinol:cytochrome C oxidoreductase [Kaistella soli]MCG2779780.1 quinol:cytochrome C oxidoreductase [Weeksellaceae bacterium]OWK75105.1 quinol:cytochrome C oxidoreductase [Flavobacteriaceae bacterium JJC]
MYSFSPKLRLYSIIFIVLGLVLFGAGYFMNHGMDDARIEHMMEAVHAGGNHAPTNSSEMVGPQDHAAHLEHAKMQVHNQPLAAIHTVAVFLFALSCCALFFYCIQNAAHAGWSIIILRVMEAIASYIPYGGAIVVIIMILNITHQGHLFHWMDPELTEPGNIHFDAILFEKKIFLNIPFYAVRTLIYVIGASFFAWKLKSLSKKVDDTKSRKVYASYYSWSVGYIAFFGFASAAWAWDWLMSIDPHWYSTMYIWYAMVSCLSSAIAAIILISVYLKKNGFLPQFNDNHLHDLGVFLFATSMLWTYTWFAQFMLYWYANVPEEVNYFFGRFKYYSPTFLPMLIVNFLIPLLVLVSSSIKRNYMVVTVMAVVVLCGHWLDYFNMVMPGTVGPYWKTPEVLLLNLGSVLFGVGLFIFVVMTALSKLKLIPEGNPFLKESKIYEYPF